jgi:prepilin-type N-terminal cleavage/methylation domain-containing protein/prepilin-type processing-associated H-X9-DG protein
VKTNESISFCDQFGRKNASRRSGFTLLELLVVIAVIIIIAALLLPALSQAKARAQQVDCMSRKKQWSMAFQMYADDNDNSIPREGYEQSGGVHLNNWGQVKGISTESDDVWYNSLPAYVGVPKAATYAPLNKHSQFYERASLFHCASAKFPKEFAYPFYVNALFSIAMNSQLIEFPYGPTIKIDRIRDEESRTVLFLDNLLREEKKVHPAQENSELGQPAAYADRFSARHYKGGNLAFADGHASWFAGNKVVQTDPSNPLRGGPIMPPVDIVWEPKYDF